MEQYVGLDVSLKETAISVRQNGKRIWRGKCPSDPQLLAEVIRKRAPNAMRVVFVNRRSNGLFDADHPANGVLLPR